MLIIVPVGLRWLDMDFMHPLATFLLCLCIYPLILAVSRASYTWIETPSIAFGRALLRTRAGSQVQMQ